MSSSEPTKVGGFQTKTRKELMQEPENILEKGVEWVKVRDILDWVEEQKFMLHQRKNCNCLLCRLSTKLEVPHSSQG